MGRVGIVREVLRVHVGRALRVQLVDAGAAGQVGDLVSHGLLAVGQRDRYVAGLAVGVGPRDLRHAHADLHAVLLIVDPAQPAGIELPPWIARQAVEVYGLDGVADARILAAVKPLAGAVEQGLGLLKAGVHKGLFHHAPRVARI